jgi:hypothetical protein
MMIINLTQHDASPEQIEAGVVDLRGPFLKDLRELLTFTELPTPDDMNLRALLISRLALGGLFGRQDKYAMIGGAPFFMTVLQDALLHHGITPVYAFSQRVSKDEKQQDGSIKKSQVFKHLGFVRTCEFAPHNY